jgi:hypothetical protein
VSIEYTIASAGTFLAVTALYTLLTHPYDFASAHMGFQMGVAVSDLAYRHVSKVHMYLDRALEKKGQSSSLIALIHT